MKNFAFIVATLALLFGALMGSADAAATLYTPLLTTPGFPAGAAVCAILNVSSTEISVTVTLFDALGVVKASQQQTIAPGAGNSLTTDLTSGGYYCKFVVPNARKVRANLLIFETPDPGSFGFVRAWAKAE